MRCVSPSKALKANGRLKKNYRYLPGGKPCIVEAGKSASSGKGCKFGRVKRGKRKGKCRTSPLPDFSKFRSGRKVSRSVAQAYEASLRAGRRPSAAMRADIAAGRSYQTGAAAFARRMRGGRPRDARGRFI